MSTLHILYFAQVREAIGVSSEQCDVPETAATIADCLDWLSQLTSNHAHALADHKKLRFALDRQIAKLDAQLGDAKELAIFPPVTGG